MSTMRVCTREFRESALGLVLSQGLPPNRVQSAESPREFC